MHKYGAVFVILSHCLVKRNAAKILIGVQSFVILFNIILYVSPRFMMNRTWLNPEQVSENRMWFLSNYTGYCEKFLLPKPSNMQSLNITKKNLQKQRLCPCIPESLIGNLNISSEVPPPGIGDLELQHYELLPGGHWFPKTCIPRHRVVVIVPYRDRELHLRHFLSVVHPFLQRQLLHYTILLVEQASPHVFNKASLMNAGFLEAQLLADFDCYIFHDVDMLPESDLNFYTCSTVPRHVGSHLDKWNYALPYPEIFGGVTAFRKEDFEKVNGFSNQYYGWGGEDDDMYHRIATQNLTFIRFPESVARYTMIKHEHDRGNPINSKRLNLLYHKDRERIYAADGLNSVRYKLRKFEARPLYTWLELELPKHPTHVEKDFWKSWMSGHSAKSKFQLSLLLLLNLILSYSLKWFLSFDLEIFY